MQQLPDIKTLYQKKYLKIPHHSIPYHQIQPQEAPFQKLQNYNEKISARSLPNKKLSCIRIIRQHPKTFRIDQNPNNLTQTSSKMKKYIYQNKEKMIQSSSKNRSKGQLMKQIMKISQQELSDLQSSMGGEKSLIDLLNLFFEKRHQIHENNRNAISNIDFKPMQNLFTRRYKEDEDKYQQYRINRKQPTPKIQKRIRQKDLAPWSVQDLQYS